jgi:hypothetical protein
MVCESCRRSSQAFFTICDYDHTPWDWHRFPRNIVVFSSGGDGDLPIPLFRGERTFRHPPKDILISFMGRWDGASDTNGVRSRMYAAMQSVAHFGYGPDWDEIMGRSVFTLCPRGLGRASFRLYEAMSVCSIPVYIWDDREWLPFAEEIPWSELIVSVPVTDLASLPDRLQGMSPHEIRDRQEKIAHYWPRYFTPVAACDIIRQLTTTWQDANDVLPVTACRQFAHEHSAA